MSLIYSNYPPLHTESDTYHTAFTKLLRSSDRVHIASGYISADALVDLKSIVDANGGPYIQLNIGMHFFDGCTRQQLQAIEDLDNTLRAAQLGGVFFVVAYPFHGKIISFTKNGTVIGALVGSSNLTNIVKAKSDRQYEVDYQLIGQDAVEIDQFITTLNQTATQPFQGLDITVVKPRRPLLHSQAGVEKVDPVDLATLKSNLQFEYSFTIPLAIEPKSNLNTFNGKGRGTTLVIPRSWYEVELIVPKAITMQPGYPQSDKNGNGGVIQVITDDGWKFSCHISGQNSKNFRSDKDLKKLGKWIKGRLEQSGALKIGDMVTESTLQQYGRSNFILAKFKNSEQWYLDFGIRSR